jgi:hypothetical protein
MVAASKRKGNHMTNCFDLRCPKCGNSEEIDISAPVWARITNDGTDTDLSANGGHEWDDDSPARCAACCHSGKVGDFQQNEYMAYFRTTAGPANDIFIADTPQRTLDLARKAFGEDPGKFGFSPADCGYLQLQEIRIVNQDGEELLVWMTDEYRLQLYAPELLKALERQIEATRGIVDAWDNTDHLPEAVEDLIAALERQSESARAVIDSWENGDLAGAVRDLEDSLTVALKAIADARGGAA